MFNEETYVRGECLQILPVLSFSAIYSEFQNVNKISSSWMEGNGFKDDRTADSYPYSAALPGVKNSLEVIMFKSNEEIDYKCSGYFHGYKVTLMLYQNE